MELFAKVIFNVKAYDNKWLNELTETEKQVILEMLEEASIIPELSDEEIYFESSKLDGVSSSSFEMGMKRYRELLKQRQ